MRSITFTLAILLSALMMTGAVLADVKIKSKQTVAGQSYENTTYIKGKRSRAESMNGMMINITQCDLHRGIQMNSASRTYMINEFVAAVQAGASANTAAKNDGVVTVGGKVTTTITTKDTGERKQMFGFTAKHLIITMETVASADSCNPNNSKMQMDGWYIDAEFALDCDQSYQSVNNNPYNKRSGCQDKYEIKTVGTAKRGYPVYEKMTMLDASGKETMSMVNEVVELSKATLDAALFETPPDYRQVSDASQMYATNNISMTSTSNNNVRGSSTTTMASLPVSSSISTSTYAGQTSSGVAQNVSALAQQKPTSSAASAEKKDGVIRIGLAGVKTAAVGEGIAAADLASATQNSLLSYLKVPNVEVVVIEAKLPSAIDAEAKEKNCDYLIYATVSHKKGGGGGFGGMFGQTLGMAVSRVGMGGLGNTAANIAGQVATQAIVTATSMSANVKSKDEITLDLKLQKDGTAVVAKQFKAKAKSNGDDIISQIVEQAAQEIVTAIGK